MTDDKNSEKKENGDILLSENERITSIIHSQALTTDEMATKFKVNKKIWEVDHFITNSWPVAAKDVHKNLQFEDGVVTGEVKSGGMVVTHLYQTKVWWVRKEPFVLTPILHPVDVSKFKFRRNAKIAENINPHILIIPDIQAGYLRIGDTEVPMHDEKALNVIRAISKKYFFSHIIFLGDVLDFAEWSDRWPTPNEQRDTTQKSLVEMSAFITDIRVNNLNSKMIYLEGNHEKRMRQLLIKLVPAAYGLKAVENIDGFPAMSIPGLLGLDKLDVEWIESYPSGEYWVDETLRIIHGTVARKSGLTAGHYVNEYEYSTVFGHIHRRELASRTLWRAGKPTFIFSASPGCLCKIENSSIVPAVKNRNNWQQGAMVITKVNGSWRPEQIDIEDGIGFFRGNKIEG